MSEKVLFLESESEYEKHPWVWWVKRELWTLFDNKEIRNERRTLFWHFFSYLIIGIDGAESGNSRPFLHYEKYYSLSLFLSQSHFLAERASSSSAITLLSSSEVHNFTLFFVLFRSTTIFSGAKSVVGVEALKASPDWLTFSSRSWSGCRRGSMELSETYRGAGYKIKGRLSWKASPLHISTFLFFLRMGSTPLAQVDQAAIRFGEQ